MGTKFSSQSTSGYASASPPDDGSQVAANLITWSGVRTKLTDVLKTFAEAINTALVSALDLSARAISSNDTAIASDHWKTLQVTGATTIQLSSAASMGAGYEVGIFNAGVGVVTVTPAGADTINGVSASVTVAVKGSMIFRTNQALTGYNVVVQTFGNPPSFPLTIGVGGATPSASGSGVSFPATQSASSDVNTLDDYEEGSWTPSIGGNATYTVQIGRYTKIGKVVFIQMEFTINVIGTGSTTVISGLPFSADAFNQFSFYSPTWSSIATAVISLTGRANSGASTITLLSSTAATVTTGSNAIFGNGATVTLSGFYLTST